MTAQSEVGRLARVAMKHPRDAFRSQAAIDSEWRALGFVAPPDFARACAEFDSLLQLLHDHGVEVLLLPPDARTGIDSVYARDASVATDSGVIICSMGKPLRAGEATAQRDALSSLGIRVVGSIEAPGTLEGGDLAWLDRRTLAVGLGYRTNAAGIAQLRVLLGDLVDELIVVPLPHWRGPEDVMHLMSLVSPVGERAAVVYSPLLPVQFRSELVRRGYRLIEVPDHEFESMGTNVLAIEQQTVLVLRGNPTTRAALERAGFDVVEYDGTEISVKGSGGPTCLTRPVLRQT